MFLLVNKRINYVLIDFKLRIFRKGNIESYSLLKSIHLMILFWAIRNVFKKDGYVHDLNEYAISHMRIT